MNVGEYRLEQTCGACPEQYDVYRGEELVGYLRLRHGHFTARYMVGAETVLDAKTVYRADTEGDGSFYDEEREFFLTSAIAALDKELNKKEE